MKNSAMIFYPSVKSYIKHEKHEYKKDIFKATYYFARKNHFLILSKINPKGNILVCHRLCGFTFWISNYDFFTAKYNPCPYCRNNFENPKNQKWLRDFIRLVNIATNNHYFILNRNNYLLLGPICIIHKTCGKEFMTSPLRFLLGYRCEYCYKKQNSHIKTSNKFIRRHIRTPEFIKQEYMSNGERKIWTWLRDHYFYYIYGYIMKCKLHLDFYLPLINTGIEFDGKQHFYSWQKIGGKSTLYRQDHNDRLKDLYCYNHNIRLIRIPYNKYNDINKILKNKLTEK